MIENRPQTVAQQFLGRVQKSGGREAYRYPVGDQWESVTWKETGDRVTRLSAGLIALGIEPQALVGTCARGDGQVRGVQRS